MKPVLASCSASISELKRNPTALLKAADGRPWILNHNTPSAYGAGVGWAVGTIRVRLRRGRGSPHISKMTSRWTPTKTMSTRS